MLRLVFGRPWRQTEGMLGSIIDLLGLELPIPDHTTFSCPADVDPAADQCSFSFIALRLRRTPGGLFLMICSQKELLRIGTPSDLS
jgi:hypothetical protein